MMNMSQNVTVNHNYEKYGNMYMTVYIQHGTGQNCVFHITAISWQYNKNIFVSVYETFFKSSVSWHQYSWSNRLKILGIMQTSVPVKATNDSFRVTPVFKQTSISQKSIREQTIAWRYLNLTYT